MRSDSGDKPISIVGPLFGLCITFWSYNLVQFVWHSETWPWRASEGFGGAPAVEAGDGRLPDAQPAIAREDTDGQPPPGETSAEPPGEPDDAPVGDLADGETTDAENAAPGAASEATSAGADPAQAASADKPKLFRRIAEDPVRSSKVKAGLTLVSGILFLLDLLCILWWYSRYIYVVQPTMTLWTHFLDFSICGMFATASNAWDKPLIFLWATVIACLFLLLRFGIVYNCADATDTDRFILLRAAVALGVAAVVVSVPTLVVLVYQGGSRVIYDTFIIPGVPGLLAAIGVVLTISLASRIAVATSIHTGRRHRFEPMKIAWPSAFDDAHKQHIRMNVSDGLSDFQSMFGVQGKKLRHVVLPSRVHSAADLIIQGFILAVSSHKTPQSASEISKKAMVVGISHWLDDLVDGREERRVLRALSNRRVLGSGGRLSFDFGDENKQLNAEKVELIFERIYKREVKVFTGPRVYNALLDNLSNSLGDQLNRSYMFFGLNRVATGAALYSPWVRQEIREKLLISHNSSIRNLVEGAANVDESWRREIGQLLTEIDADDTGRDLLGLTTKTVQELAMSSEQQVLNFPLSVLYSLLYAPLLYFHDIEQETNCGEMIPLDRFNVNHALIQDWLRAASRLCNDKRAQDDRVKQRNEQLAMGFLSFHPHLPSAVRDLLYDLYVPDRDSFKFEVAAS